MHHLLLQLHTCHSVTFEVLNALQGLPKSHSTTSPNPTQSFLIAITNTTIHKSFLFEVYFHATIPSDSGLFHSLKYRSQWARTLKLSSNHQSKVLSRRRDLLPDASRASLGCQNRLTKRRRALLGTLLQRTACFDARFDEQLANIYRGTKLVASDVENSLQDGSEIGSRAVGFVVVWTF